MTRTVLLLAALTALALPGTRPAAADPMKCVVVYDDNGNPVRTVCVPYLSR
jgi:hypothetical protein